MNFLYRKVSLASCQSNLHLSDPTMNAVKPGGCTTLSVGHTGHRALDTSKIGTFIWRISNDKRRSASAILMWLLMIYSCVIGPKDKLGPLKQMITSKLTDNWDSSRGSLEIQRYSPILNIQMKLSVEWLSDEEVTNISRNIWSNFESCAAYVSNK